jgi:transposase
VAYGNTLAKLGEDASEMLEYVPASFKVIRHVRPKLGRTCCDCIVQGAGGEPADRTRPGRTGTAGARRSRQVL